MGVLAHVDAGKTTLTEAMLYASGALRKAGRVDHRDTLLDSDEIERKRGITILAKQAVMPLGDMQLTLLDTPGHVDFVAETQRAMPVMDYAVLVISATDGVQSHTLTLWQLLLRHKIPTFVFVNKIDLLNDDKTSILAELQNQCSENCIDFALLKSNEIEGDLAEQIALCDEELMQVYLDKGKLTKENVAAAIKRRSIFPCYFGSALKQEGVKQFLQGMQEYIKTPVFDVEFGAYVYKITQDENNVKLVHLKITGGEIAVKSTVEYDEEDNNTSSEKINELRIYSGPKYTPVQKVCAGMLCCATGLAKADIGDCFGSAKMQNTKNSIEPVFAYKAVFDSSLPVQKVYAYFKELEKEDPSLNIKYNELTREITVKIMGEVQLEVLQTRLKQRFDLDVTWKSGKIIYKETILKTTYGTGHFEPLRHYAEVLLKLEPLKQGAGLVFETAPCKNAADARYQQLILTHLREKEHVGALIGAAITDIKITVMDLRAHLKHTQGGDFRQATYRALRNALRKAQSEGNAVLLEPFYAYKLQTPMQFTGRAMTDLQNMNATVSAPNNIDDTAVLQGFLPIDGCLEYSQEVARYTKGLGKFTCAFSGYEKCARQEEIVNNSNYNADADIENTADSVFCTHGSGYTVPWNEVEEHMHIEFKKKNEDNFEVKIVKQEYKHASDKELLEIYERTYGKVKQREHSALKPVKKDNAENKKLVVYNQGAKKDDYLLVDGYNIIHSWDETKELAKNNLESARKNLIDRLCNYKGVTKAEIIVVFDAYKVKNGIGENERVNNINVVYTKEAETADMYIEKVTQNMAKTHNIRVATSDALEQMIILGHGALRMSAKMLLEEIENAEKFVGDYTMKK